jgi:phosphate transport system permease protein
MQELVPQDVPRTVRPSRARSDRLFRGLATGAGTATLIILVLIGVFLLIRALPAFRLNGIIPFLTTFEWNTEGGTHTAGAGAVIIGTFIVAIIGLVIGVPISVFAALLVTEYAPRRLRKPMVTVIDLMAAIPAVIFGIWGFFFLQPRIIPVARWLTNNLGFIPFFQTTEPAFVASQFLVGVVIALMLIPTATSVIREVFSQTPQGEKEAALALGSTRWEMVRTVVFPFGRGGVVGGSMLALGRALGEAIVVAMLISPIFTVNTHILQTGGNTVGAMIANRFSESSPQYGVPALMAAGLILFLITVLINTLASFVVRRSRSGSGVEI